MIISSPSGSHNNPEEKLPRLDILKQKWWWCYIIASVSLVDASELDEIGEEYVYSASTNAATEEIVSM